MNVTYVVSVAIMIVSMSVSGGVFGRLPAPQFLDTEVSAQYRLDQSGAVNILDFSLVFNGTPSNNVEVAFGCDADADNVLAVHETEMIIGWRCGRYFIENFRTGETVEETNVGTNGVGRSLVWNYRVRENRSELRSFAVTNEVGAVFLGLAATKPGWIYNGDWNLMRLTARGVDVLNEHFEVDVHAKAMVIMLE